MSSSSLANSRTGSARSDGVAGSVTAAGQSTIAIAAKKHAEAQAKAKAKTGKGQGDQGHGDDGNSNKKD